MRGNYNTGGDNGDCVVPLVYESPIAIKLAKAIWSYDGDPTGGKLTVEVGGVTEVEIDIITSGPNWIPLHLEVKKDVVVTLAAGGAGVVGKLNVIAEKIN